MLNSVSDLDDLCIGKVIFPTCILEFDCRGKQFRRKRVSNIIAFKKIDLVIDFHQSSDNIEGSSNLYSNQDQVQKGRK